jgi:hypothetical protein
LVVTVDPEGATMLADRDLLLTAVAGPGADHDDVNAASSPVTYQRS